MEVNTITPQHTLSTEAPVTVSGEQRVGDLSAINVSEIASLASDPGVFIEVLDKHDSVQHRGRFEQLPITIGNSYRCDYILDSKGPLHIVTISRGDDGVLHAESHADSAEFHAPSGSTRRWMIDPDQSFTLAGERIRVRTRDYVAPRVSASASVIARLGGWMVLVAISLALAVNALQKWVNDIDGLAPSKYLSDGLGVIGALAIWSGVWALVSRLNGKSSHYLSHFSLAALAFFVMAVLGFSLESVGYALNLSWVSRYAYVVVALCVALLVWCHVRYIVRARVVAAFSTALAVFVGMFALSATSHFSERDNMAASTLLSTLRPPGWRIVNGSSIDVFLKNAADLEARAMEAIKEKPEGAEAFDSSN